MTNEQFAMFIQQGGNDELIPLLWERVRKLMHMLSDRYYRAYSEKLAAYGITADDLKSAVYPAFLRAINSFDEDKGYKFTSYLKHPLKNEFRKMLTKDSLNSAESLNALIESDKGDDSIERIDMLTDETALDFVEQVDRDSLCETVRSAVKTLPPEQQDYIHRRFYDRLTLKEIAQSEGKSAEAVRQYEKKILKSLRYNKAIFKLGNELGYDSQRVYHNSLSNFKRYGISNAEYVAIMRADITQLIEMTAKEALSEQSRVFEESNHYQRYAGADE